MAATLTITRNALATGPVSVDIHKRNLETVASYNWIDSHTPTIVVPGSPPLWAPTGTPTRVKPDTGFRFIYQNSYRVPSSPLEPLFRACIAHNPAFDLGSVDIVTDRNNLRKLLGFVTGNRDSFEIQLQRVGTTTLFERCERASYEVIKPYEFRGFGHEFEKEYTEETVEGATGHHRIVSYKFGGLQMLVRFEVDAMIGAETPADNEEEEEEEDITIGSVTIRKGGFLPPIESIAEIKTRVAHKTLDMNDVMPQLSFSQTSWLLVAYHQKGLFGTVQTHEMEKSGKFRRWEEQRKTDLEKLVWLLKRIVAAVKQVGGRAVLEFRNGTLVVKKTQLARELVPEDLKKVLGG